MGGGNHIWQQHMEWDQKEINQNNRSGKIILGGRIIGTGTFSLEKR